MNKKKLKIPQTIAVFYTDIGGVNNYVVDLSEQLVKICHEVKAFYANEPSKSKNIFRIEVKLLNYWFKITNTNIISWLPIEILRSKYDIVHAHIPTLWISDWSIFLSKLMGEMIMKIMSSGILSKKKETALSANSMKKKLQKEL
jgi:hypothetical protein